MTREINNCMDVIDSRDIVKRISELESELEGLGGEDLDNLADEQEELELLKALAEYGEGFPDWNHGATLISDYYFEDYAQQFAEDLGLIQRNAAWPNNHIDWEAAADALKADYSSLEFDGVTYWLRS